MPRFLPPPTPAQLFPPASLLAFWENNTEIFTRNGVMFSCWDVKSIISKQLMKGESKSSWKIELLKGKQFFQLKRCPSKPLSHLHSGVWFAHHGECRTLWGAMPLASKAERFSEQWQNYTRGFWNWAEGVCLGSHPHRRGATVPAILNPRTGRSA